MKYLKDCPEPGMGTWYFEIDSDGVAYRQIVIQDDGTYIASNRKHEQYHFLLAEKSIDDTEPYYTKITKEEFEEVWSNYLQAFNKEWHQVKTVLPVGTKVEGYIEAFFPQGTLIHIFQHDAVGLADARLYGEKTPSEWMYPKHEITAIVKGYDELNQWVILDQTQVLKTQYVD
ncbi:hypothetical protein [Paenibacillus maysiensis]|uniref:hypothetical protein n=1 Tax=Paenibacillus maysiensis TaxID=1155954 RepID=UPI0004710494|nr:hypothetical protein [Paenibacillus maysiensis]